MSKQTQTQVNATKAVTLQYTARNNGEFNVTLPNIEALTLTKLALTSVPKGTDAMKRVKYAELTAEQKVIRDAVNAYWMQYANIARTVTLTALSECDTDAEVEIVFDSAMRAYSGVFDANKAVFTSLATNDKASADEKLWAKRAQQMSVTVERAKEIFALADASKVTSPA